MKIKALAAAVFAALVSSNAASYVEPNRMDWTIIGDDKWAGSYQDWSAADPSTWRGHGLGNKLAAMPEGFRVINLSYRNQVAWIALMKGVGNSANQLTPPGGNVIIDIGTTDWETNPLWGLSVADFAVHYDQLLTQVVGSRTNLGVKKVFCVVPYNVSGQLSYDFGELQLYHNVNLGLPEPMNGFGETHNQYQEVVQSFIDAGRCTGYYWKPVNYTPGGWNTEHTGAYQTVAPDRFTTTGVQKLWNDAHYCWDQTQNNTYDCRYAHAAPWWMFDGVHNPEIVHYP